MYIPTLRVDNCCRFSLLVCTLLIASFCYNVLCTRLIVVPLASLKNMTLRPLDIITTALIQLNCNIGIGS